jgi:site-specific DNA-cytosine methylase
MYPRVLEWIADAVPRVVVMENSIEITRKKSTVEYFDNWFRQLAHLGYEGTIWGLSSASFGTPQNRERAFVVCWPKGASWGAHLQAPPPPTHADPRSPAVKDGALLPWTRAFDRLNSGCCAGWALTSCVSLGNLEGSCSFCVDGINYEPAPNQSAEEIRADLSAADIAMVAPGTPGSRAFRRCPHRWRGPGSSSSPTSVD